MSKALLFPGQGAQYSGMAKDLYDNNDKARQLLDEIFSQVDFDLKTIMFEEDERLNQTQYTQPALFAHSLAVIAAIDVEAEYVVGHSLGEIPALVYAGVLSLEDGLKIVVKRGELMSQASDGKMAAVIGMDIEAITETCDELSNDNERIAPANLNAPDQVVISGTSALIDEFSKVAKSKGARRVLELNVSGAFHSHLMDDAKKEFAEYIEDIQFNDTKVPVIQNYSAKDEERGIFIKMNLIEQITAPVRFVESIEHLVKLGVTEVLEVGPKRVLSGLVKKIDNSLTIQNVDKIEDVEAFIND